MEILDELMNQLVVLRLALDDAIATGKSAEVIESINKQIAIVEDLIEKRQAALGKSD